MVLLCQRQRTWPNSLNPVSPSRCRSQAHTRHHRLPDGANHLPVQLGVSMQCAAWPWGRGSSASTSWLGDEGFGVVIAWLRHRCGRFYSLERMRPPRSPSQNLNAAFEDAGAPALREFLKNPASPTPAVVASIIESILIIETHLIQQEANPKGPLG